MQILHYIASFVLVTIPEALFLLVVTGTVAGRHEKFRVGRRNLMAMGIATLFLAVSFKVLFQLTDRRTFASMAILFLVMLVVGGVLFEISVSEWLRYLASQFVAFLLILITRGTTVFFFMGALTRDTFREVLKNGLLSFGLSFPPLVYELTIMFFLLAKYFGTYEISLISEIKKEYVFKWITGLFIIVNTAVTSVSVYAFIFRQTLMNTSFPLGIKIFLIDTLLLIPFLTLGVFFLGVFGSKMHELKQKESLKNEVRILTGMVKIYAKTMEPCDEITDLANGIEKISKQINE